MKNKEFIIMVAGSLLLLGFVIFMMMQSYKSTETNLIRQDLKNDSIIFKENYELKIHDSMLKSSSLKLKSALDNHEFRLKKLETRKPIIYKDTIVILGN